MVRHAVSVGCSVAAGIVNFVLALFVVLSA